jgi:hypothetical protein
LKVEKVYMGRSHVIEQMIKDNADNEQLLSNIEETLLADTGKVTGKLYEMIMSFYTGNERKWVHEKYVTGHLTSYELVREWSLDNVVHTISNIVSVVITKEEPILSLLPIGVNTSPDIYTINLRAGIDETHDVMIRSNVINTVTSMVNSLGNINVANKGIIHRSVSLGQGLRLFIGLSHYSVRSDSFFDNLITLGYYYIFNIHYSYDEFSNQVEQSIIEQYNRTLNDLRDASEENFNHYLENIITFEQYIVRSDIITQQIKEVNDRVEELRKETIANFKSIDDGVEKWYRRMFHEYGHNKDIHKILTQMINIQRVKER